MKTRIKIAMGLVLTLAGIAGMGKAIYDGKRIDDLPLKREYHKITSPVREAQILESELSKLRGLEIHGNPDTRRKYESLKEKLKELTSVEDYGERQRIYENGFSRFFNETLISRYPNVFRYSMLKEKLRNLNGLCLARENGFQEISSELERLSSEEGFESEEQESLMEINRYSAEGVFAYSHGGLLLAAIFGIYTGLHIKKVFPRSKEKLAEVREE